MDFHFDAQESKEIRKLKLSPGSESQQQKPSTPATVPPPESSSDTSRDTSPGQQHATLKQEEEPRSPPLPGPVIKTQSDMKITIKLSPTSECCVTRARVCFAKIGVPEEIMKLLLLTDL